MTSIEASDLRRHQPRKMLGYVCTFTAECMPGGVGHGEGVVLVSLDPATGLVTALRNFAAPSPAWMAIAPSGDHAYVVNEIGRFEGRAEGSVTSYAIDRTDGGLTRLNAVGSGGIAPAHCSVHPSGRFVLVANYASGHVSVLPIRADGALGAATDRFVPPGVVGPGIAANAPPGSFARSGHDAPHVHMIATDPSGHFVLSNDLGQDSTHVWTLDAGSGRLHPHAPPAFPAASAGAGPRHFAFHPNRRLLFNLYEEASELAVYDFDGRSARVALRQQLSTLPPGFAGSSFASAIAVSRDGRFVYTGNRLHNSVARFAVEADGRVHLLDTEWTRGDYPNHVALDPTGQFLLACNRRSDQVTVFRVDPGSGALAFTGQYLPIGSPNMIAFIDPVPDLASGNLDR